MNEILTTVELLTNEEKQLIIRSLVGYNDTKVPAEGFQDLAVVSRCDGKVIGGLIGYTHWNWLFVKQLWVDQDFRGQGIGRHLMFSAEREASKRGCSHAHCDTFDFQALPFYQLLGYSVFGSLEDYPAGHTRYFLQKRNLSAFK
jgi:GNAT superfamily N-acetyltransferase